MYAIIGDGSHQYKVEVGQVVEMERLPSLAEGATSVEFDRVLLLGGLEGGPKIGNPVVAGAKVSASVLGEFKGDKIIIQKHRRRKGYHLKKGHRQNYLRVKIEKIEV